MCEYSNYFPQTMSENMRKPMPRTCLSAKTIFQDHVWEHAKAMPDLSKANTQTMFER